MYSVRRSGCLFELERALAQGLLRLAGFLMRMVGQSLVQGARAVTALCLGTTREMIEWTSLAWEERGWPDIAFLPVYRRWHYALIGGLLWIVGYVFIRIALAVLGLASLVTAFALATALHPICLPVAPLVLLFLAGGVAGWLAYRGVDDPLTW